MANADRIIDLLHEARARPAGAERERFLAEACRDDVAVKAQVLSLLEADENEGDFQFLKTRMIRPLAVPAEKSGDRIGRYKLLEQIGEGGCGMVYIAEQEEPVRRLVALKVIKLGMDTKQVIARFDAERQALALMDHPNIARVLDAGATANGRPFFVMELVRGIRITDYCDESNLTTRERLDLFIKVCQAIQHAHQKGIIHRDIKPSNILVTLNDGVAVPKVIDFGIAKATQGRLTDQTICTAFEQFIGTPAYMSPEQAEMTSLDIDTRSDIYSLGVLLYELLAGSTPFDPQELMSQGLDAMRKIIRENEPTRPSTKLAMLTAADLTTTARRRSAEAPRLIRQLSGDLDWIVMKCLEKDRTRRYETANGLAVDIQRHLANEPVVARPPSKLYEFRKTVRRHRFGFAAAAVVVLALMLGMVGTTWQAVRAGRAEHAQIRWRLQEEAARARAEASDRASRDQLYTALLEQARATVRSGEMGQRVRALEAVRRAAAISNSAELRGAALAALALPDLRFEREFSTPSVLANLDPGFERIAIPLGLKPTEIRALSDGRLLASLAPSAKVPAQATWWSPDGAFLAVKRDLDPDGHHAYLEVWATADARRVLLLDDLCWDGVSFHPSLPQIVTGRKGGMASVFDLNNGSELARFKLPATALRLRLAPDGKRLAFAGETSGGWLVSIHRAADGSLLASNHWANQPSDFSWSPVGDCLAVPDWKGEVRLMDARTGEARSLGWHKAQAAKTAFSPDGVYLFTGGWERELICWDVRARRRLFNVNLDSYRLQFRADGRECAVRTTSGAYKFYAFDRPTHREFFEDLGGRISHASFSGDGRWMAASGDKSLGLWNLSGGAPGALLEAGAETRAFFTPDGRELFTSRDNDCGRWRIGEGPHGDSPPEIVRLPLYKPAGFRSICLASNFLVVTATNHSSIIPFDHLADETVHWTRTASGVNAVSPDGRWLGICHSFSPSLYIYSVPGLQLVKRITAEKNIKEFKFSPRGDEVAVTTKGIVTFWSTADWRVVRVVTNATEFLYTPDAGTCWIAEDYRSAALRDMHTLEMLLPLPLGTHPLALSPDGRRLAVSVDLRRVQVWDLAEVRAQLQELGLGWPER